MISRRNIIRLILLVAAIVYVFMHIYTIYTGLVFSKSVLNFIKILKQNKSSKHTICILYKKIILQHIA